MPRFSGFIAGHGLIHVAIDPDKELREFLLSDCGLFLAVIEKETGEARVFVERKPLDRWESWMELGRAQNMTVRPHLSEVAIADPEAQCVRRVELHNRIYLPSLSITNPTAICYSADGDRIAAGNRFGKVAVWNLEVDGPARFEAGWTISNSAISCINFAGNRLVAMTEDGRCLRSPAIEPTMYRVGSTDVEPALCGGDGQPISLLCQSYDMHPQVFLECFGLEGGLLVGRHLANSLTWYFQTELGAVTALKFWTDKGQLIAIGPRGVEIWKTELLVMSQKWMVSGDLSKLGRAAMMPTCKLEFIEPPAPGLKPISIASLARQPVIAWTETDN